MGSRRRRQPICCVWVWIIPAQTKLSGFGSIPSRSCIPKPSSFVLAESLSMGEEAWKIFWDFWDVLEEKNRKRNQRYIYGYMMLSKVCRELLVAAMSKIELFKQSPTPHTSSTCGTILFSWFQDDLMNQNFRYIFSLFVPYILELYYRMFFFK